MTELRSHIFIYISDGLIRFYLVHGFSLFVVIYHVHVDSHFVIFLMRYA